MHLGRHCNRSQGHGKYHSVASLAVRCAQSSARLQSAGADRKARAHTAERPSPADVHMSLTPPTHIYTHDIPNVPARYGRRQDGALGRPRRRSAQSTRHVCTGLHTSQPAGINPPAPGGGCRK